MGSSINDMNDADKYIVDVCCSINALLVAASDTLPGSVLVCDGGASLSPTGVAFLSSLRNIYEVVLPRLAATSDNRSLEEGRETMTALCIARDACLCSFDEIMCISLNIDRQDI